jgi:hypothetical protein
MAVEGMQVRTKATGYLVPQSMCVACGLGPVAASLKKSTGSSNSSLNVTFPLCEACDSARQRVGAAGRRLRKRCGLLALPLAVGVLGLWSIANPVADWVNLAVLFAFGLVWLILYRLLYVVALMVGLDRADPQDRAVESSVEIKIVEELHAWTDGETQFTFANPAYALEFRTANLGNLIQPKVRRTVGALLHRR